MITYKQKTTWNNFDLFLWHIFISSTFTHPNLEIDIKLEKTSKQTPTELKILHMMNSNNI